MLIIGIAGGTGSGKTTVVKKIISYFHDSEVTVLSQDSYYRDNSHMPLKERLKINFDHPKSLEFELLIKHLHELKKGKTIQEPIYSYLTCIRSEETVPVKPRQVVIVEGILVLTNKELRDLFDIKLFVDADADDRLMRVVKRDIIERGRSVNTVLERYDATVKPMHLQFIEPSKKYADVIIPQGGHNKVAINILTAVIQQKLNDSKHAEKN